MHPVETFIRSRVDMPQPEIDWILSRMKTRTLEPGEPFCRMGDERHEIGLLLGGLLRVFAVADDGGEATLDFVFPVEMATAVDAATANSPSQVTFEALEKSSLAIWPFSIRNEAAARHPAWTELMRIEMEGLFRRKNRYARSLQTKDAASRYREWIAEHPEASARIPQYFVASYLGIAPQSLSRIRAQLRHGEPSLFKHGKPRNH